MDNLSETIKLLFCKIKAEKVLDKLLTAEDLDTDPSNINHNNFSRSEIEKVMRAYTPYLTAEEIEHIINSIIDESRAHLPEMQNATPVLNVFDLVLYFSDSVLIMRNGKITCRYKELLKWHMLSHDMDEDTFTTAFAAYHDKKFGYVRKSFNWSNIIKSDNVRLKSLLSQGVAENHFHLKGSAPVFQLNWINLMNEILNTNIVKKNKICENLNELLENPLNPSIHTDNSNSSDLYTLVIKAAVIRFFLFCEMTNELDLLWPCISIDWRDISSSLDTALFKSVKLNIKTYNQYVRGIKSARASFSSIRLSLLSEEELFIATGISEDVKRSLKELLAGLFYHLALDSFPQEDGSMPITVFFNKIQDKSCQLKLHILENLMNPHNYLRLRKSRQKSFILEVLASNNATYDLDEIDEINSSMERFREEYSYKFSDKHKAADYAILKENILDESTENIFFHGERKLMYDVYKSLFLDEQPDNVVGNLFYAYLLIKIRFRSEMIQSNNYIGFDNFEKYQDRKENFISWNPLFTDALISTAINDSIKNQTIHSIEARITPPATAEKMKKRIKDYDEIIRKTGFRDENFDDECEKDDPLKKSEEDNLLKKIFYVFSIPKESKKIAKSPDEYQLSYRHKTYVEHLESLAREIVRFRIEHPDQAKRVYGIDACASELFLRPEVFGPMFRYLSSHTVYEDNSGDIRLPTLKKTYHTGEDFFDLVDGMRAIEEAVIFLDLGEGDRIGHALALGLDVATWYRKKKMHVQLDRHTLLDNLAWLYAQIRKYNMSEFLSLSTFIEKQFVQYFHEVYGTATKYDEEYLFKKEFIQYFHKVHETAPMYGEEYLFKKDELVPNIMLFYDAWKLRGDHPSLYRNFGEFYEEHLPNQRERFYKNSYKFRNSLHRKNNVVANLYYRYHYDSDVRKRGAVSVEFEIPPDYVKCAAAIQMNLQKKISRDHIGIECNPSSNFSIASLEKYIDHPIFKWYNMGLSGDISSSPQMFVSINTDDQGVFNTNLENEYALLSIALEKQRDADGVPIYSQAQVYNWLDSVRRMGLEQSFNFK